MSETSIATSPPGAASALSTILLIEDSPSDAMMVQAMLAERVPAKFECVWVPTLAEGLAVIADIAPVCVVVDLGLPDSDGLDTLDQVIAQAPNVPIVILTAFNDELVGLTAVSRGAQDYLVKGKTDGELLSRTIGNAIERIRAEISIHRSEVRYRSLLDISPNPIIACTLDRVVTLWNQAAEDVYGWSAAEALGMPLESLLAINGRGGYAFPGDILSLKSSNEDARYGTKSGRVITVETRWVVMRDEDGRASGFLSTHSDITARRAIEDELSRSNADLQQFANVASHDLSEPLRTISDFVRLLAQRYTGRLDDDADEFIGFILEGVSREKALIADLLGYSKVSRADHQLTTVDCSQLLSDVVTFLGVGDAVTWTTLPSVVADASQLERVFQNLVGNGLKFVPAERRACVAVSAQRGEGCWQFSVSDNGIGIAEDDRMRVFQMFQRLHSQDDYSGTGMGLAICQRIIERHGGRIWAESNDGIGTTFRFSIPDPENRTVIEATVSRTTSFPSSSPSTNGSATAT